MWPPPFMKQSPKSSEENTSPTSTTKAALSRVFPACASLAVRVTEGDSRGLEGCSGEPAPREENVPCKEMGARD